MVELIQHQTDTRFTLRVRWFYPFFGLPGRVIRDSVIVFVALWRFLIYREEPNSGFEEVPQTGGDGSSLSASRRVLLIVGESVAPNTFVLGVDRERDVMVVHQLVRPPQRTVSGRPSDGVIQ